MTLRLLLLITAATAAAHISITPTPTAAASLFSPAAAAALHYTSPRPARASVPRCAANSEAVGGLVVFSDGNGGSTLGAIAGEASKKRWQVVDGRGKSHLVGGREIKHVVAQVTGADAQLVAKFEAAAAAAAALADGVELLWEMTHEGAGAAVALAEAAELMLDGADSESQFAAYSLLSSEDGRVFFKASADGRSFTPRGPEQVEALRQQRQREADAAAALEALRLRIAAASDAAPLDLTAETDDVRADFEAVCRLGCRARKPAPTSTSKSTSTSTAAAGEEAEPTDERAKAFLQRLGRKATAESAWSLLVACGVWNVHEQLDLIRLRVPTVFDEALEQEASDIVASPPPDPDADIRRDLRHLHAVAIDDEHTVEVDDALSVELLPDGSQRFWIHIADATAAVTADSALAAEARRRGMSVYLPTGTIPMLPLALAAGPLSLRPDADALALSVGVAVSPDGSFSTEEVLIVPTMVRVQRLTYSQVDAALAATFADAGAESSEGAEGAGSIDPEVLELLRRLEWASAARRSYRISGGAIEAVAPEQLPDVSIKVNRDASAPDGWQVRVGLGDASRSSAGLARRLVSECMLLAGEAVARHGEALEVPLPYRSQATRGNEPLPHAEDLGPEGLCRTWNAIRLMAPSKIGATAKPHEGLGLDAYVQVTSPIRRFADLAVHYQFKALLRGEPHPFSSAEMVQIARDGTSRARGLERSSSDYWLQEFFRRHAGQPFSALVLGEVRSGTSVYKLLLTEIGAMVDHKSSAPLTSGQRISVSPTKLGDFGS